MQRNSITDHAAAATAAAKSLQPLMRRVDRAARIGLPFADLIRLATGPIVRAPKNPRATT